MAAEHPVDVQGDGAPPDAMSRFRRWVAIAVAVASIGWVLYAAVRGFSETADALGGYAWLTYIPVLGLTLVNYGLRYIKWNYLLGQLDIRVAHRHNIPIFLAGLAMAISPAKAGEVVKPYLVRVVAGANMSRTIPALIAERMTDGIAVVCLAAIGVTTYAADATSMVVGIIAAIALGIVALSQDWLMRPLIGLGHRIPVVDRFADRIDEAYDATRAVLAPGPLLFTIVLSGVAWFAECLGAWMIFLGLGMDASLDQSTFLYTFSTLIGIVSPGGLGVSELALAEGAIQLIEGTTAGQALAGSLLVRVATLWFGVVLGAIAFLRMEQVIQSARAESAAAD